MIARRNGKRARLERYVSTLVRQAEEGVLAQSVLLAEEDARRREAEDKQRQERVRARQKGAEMRRDILARRAQSQVRLACESQSLSQATPLVSATPDKGCSKALPCKTPSPAGRTRHVRWQPGLRFPAVSASPA